MSRAGAVTPQRVVVESTPDRMSFGMPEVHLALDELNRRRGELFCDFGFIAINVGTIPADGPVITFEESTLGNDGSAGYAVLKHDGATQFRLSNSGRTGGIPIDSDPPVKVVDDIRMYLGTTSARGIGPYPLPNGPTVVEVSGDPNKSTEYGITRDTLAIGTRAVGAFALGKAMKELRTEPRNFDLSLGLLVAAHLEKQGVDWRPREGRAGRKVDEIIASLEENYIDQALVPATLRELGLGRSRAQVNSIGNRLPLFHLTFSDARNLLQQKLHQLIESDEEVRKQYGYLRQDHGAHGDFGEYLKVALDNFLANRLGLKDPEVA